MKKKLASVIILLALLVAFVGCDASDPLRDDLYTRGDIYIWDGAAWVPVVAGGGGNVTAAANLTTDMIIVGDGGIFGVKTTTVQIDGFGNVDTGGGDLAGFDINAGNDVNVVNDLDVTDDGQIGGDLVVIGTLTVGGYPVPDTNYAGMYRYDSAVVTDIQVANAWHLVNGFTTGYLGGGWAFHAGEQLAITAYADNGDGKTLVTSAGHVLVDGDLISIAGTVNYDGIWLVEQVLVNTFVIDTPWVADDGASVGEHGSHFSSAVATSAGKYLVTYSLSLKPSSANCVVEALTVLNTTLETKSASRTKLGAITDYQNVAGFSIVDIAVNDVVSLALQNITDAGDFTIIDGNMTLVKLGN